jgi:hypothetical protein
VRPNEVDWYAVDQPEWYAGEGWALTPESAGVAASDRRGLASGPIEAWIRRRHTGGVLAIGGRSLDPARTPRLTVAVEDGSGDRQTVVDDAVPPGSFLRFAAIPPGPEGDIGRDAAYSRVEVRATDGGSLAIEQFAAAPAGGIVYGFGDGWQEPEFNPTTGARWRWLSERGEIRIGSRPPAAMVLSLDGESPLRYFSRGSRLRIRSGDQLLFDDTLSADFALTVHVPSGADTLVLETDQVYVPAERGWRRSADRRHLGLRIFNVRLR